MLQTVDRALRLLLLYEEVDQEYRVGEMAAMLGVDKSSASRLAATLANRGFLERAPGSEAFRIGPELGRLGVLSVGVATILSSWQEDRWKTWRRRRRRRSILPVSKIAKSST